MSARKPSCCHCAGALAGVIAGGRRSRCGRVIADALDAAAVQEAVVRVRPDAVINELTALPRNYTPAEMAASAERDRKVRIEGKANILAALGAAGVRRYLLQSSAFWYAPGPGLADEREPFAVSGSPAVSAGSRRYAELENAALMTPRIAVVALRYGFFYGPSTWFSEDGDMGEQVRRRQVPVIGDGQGVWSWVHTRTPRRRRPPPSNARRAPTISSMTIPCRSGFGCRLSRRPSARRRRPGCPKPRRPPLSVPMRCISNPAARRRERQGETRIAVSAAAARVAFAGHNRNPDCPVV